MMRQAEPAALSADPLRNMQYLFVANITLATRFAIEGGLDTETAYNASDMYIRKLDQCRTADEVMELHREMFSFFTSKMAAQKKESVYTRAVAESIDYIDSNLHTPLRIDEVAEHVGLSAGYFSVLFHRETGLAFSDYVMRQRIETAGNMLRYSDYSSTEISEILAFSSQSYFIKYLIPRVSRGISIHGFLVSEQSFRISVEPYIIDMVFLLGCSPRGRRIILREESLNLSVYLFMQPSQVVIVCHIDEIVQTRIIGIFGGFRPIRLCILLVLCLSHDATHDIAICALCPKITLIVWRNWRIQEYPAFSIGCVLSICSGSKSGQNT